MKSIVLIHVFLAILINNFTFLYSEKLECYECTEKSNTDPQKICSLNATRTRKATDDGDYMV